MLFANNVRHVMIHSAQDRHVVCVGYKGRVDTLDTVVN